MKYALLIYGDEALQPAEGSPEFNEMYQGYYKFTEDISSAGAQIPGVNTGTIEIRPLVDFG